MCDLCDRNPKVVARERERLGSIALRLRRATAEIYEIGRTIDPHSDRASDMRVRIERLAIDLLREFA